MASLQNKAARLSFWRVAVRPKYVAGLLLALLAASAFAWLGQWQLERSFTKDQTVEEIQQTVTVETMLDQKNIYIVEGRVQDQKEVFWLIANSKDKNVIAWKYSIIMNLLEKI